MKYLPILLLLLTACTFETSGGDDLDGFWHLTSIDTLATGTTADLSQKRIFWSVGAGLIDFRDSDNPADALMSHFSHVGDSLFLHTPYHWDRTNQDPILEDTTLLRAYGISQWKQHFLIEQLTSSRMKLQSSGTRLNFKKQ